MVKSVFVTGAGGFIGKNLVNALIKEGNVVYTSSRKKSEEINLEENIIHTKKRFQDLSVSDFKNIDVLFHMAAITDTVFEDEETMHQVNVLDSLELFKKFFSSGGKCIIYASSSSVYGNNLSPLTESTPSQPLSPYARSKLALEKSSKLLSQEFPDRLIVGLRYSNVYGSPEHKKGKRASMIWQLFNEMKEKDPKLFEFGEQVRDFIYIDDVVRATIMATKSKNSGIFNIGLGEGTSFNQLVEIINKYLNVKRTPSYIPNPYDAQYQKNQVLDISLAKESFKFSPKFSINEGIETYLKKIE